MGSAAVAGLLLLTAIAGGLPSARVDATTALPGGLHAPHAPSDAALGLSASNAGAKLVAAAANAHEMPATFAPIAFVKAAPVAAGVADSPPPRPLPHRKRPLPRSAGSDGTSH